MPRHRKTADDPTRKFLPLTLLLTASDMDLVVTYAAELSISKAAAARMLIRAGGKNLNIGQRTDDPQQ